MQEMLKCLRSEQDMQHPPLHLQSDGMRERYVRMVEEHMVKAITLHQGDWDERLSVFLLTYRASMTQRA
jgi:hypothetical protein